MRTLSILFTLFIGLAATHASADAGGFGVKGVVIGSAFSSAQALPGIHCSKTPLIEYCIWLRPMNIPDDYKTLGGIPAEMYSFYALDGKVQKIEVAYASNGHTQLKIGLSEKFGAPMKVEERVLQNRAGASFIDEEVLWRSPGGDEMKLHKFARSLDAGMLVIISKAYLSKEAAVSADKKQKALNDL